MEYMLLVQFLILASSFFTSISLSSSPYNVKAIFTFGDSIFDAGNNHFIQNCTAQADFPPYGSSFFHHATGRFTNGRTVADFISQFVGLDLQKPYLEVKNEVLNGSSQDYLRNGANFASAGSGLLRDTNREMGVIPIQDQLKQFQALIQQKKIDKKLLQQSLFMLESGSNDIFNYFNHFNTPSLSPDAYIQSMLMEASNFLDQIYKLGALRIAIFSLGPVGCVPARALLPGAPINKCFGKMNVMVKKFNNGLQSLTRDIPNKYPRAFGVYGVVYNIVQQFRANPTRYGFVDVTDACCGGGTLGGMLQCGKEGYKMCKSPNNFLFWDYFHPSEHAYSLISKSLWGGKQDRVRPINLRTLSNMSLTFI